MFSATLGGSIQSSFLNRTQTSIYRNAFSRKQIAERIFLKRRKNFFFRRLSPVGASAMEFRD